MFWEWRGGPDPRPELKIARPQVLKNTRCCVLVFLPILIFFFPLSLLSYVRELSSVCAGNLWSRGVGMVYCQGFHCGETTHYPRENFLHLRLWSIYSTVLQRKVWDLWFTSYWCEQEGTTSCKRGNETRILSVLRKLIFSYKSLRKKKWRVHVSTQLKHGQSLWNRAVQKRNIKG